MSESKSYLAPNLHQGAGENDAVFLGWQTIIDGELIPLYTITAIGHPSFHSTVSDVTLRKMHLRIPHTPSPYPSAKPSPWHRIGVDLNHPVTGGEAIEASGLNYTIVKEPLKPHMSTMHAWALVRTDTREVLGVVGDGCLPLQNKDAFAFFDPLMRKLDVIYETAGTLDRGRHIWLLAKLPGYIKVRGNDIVNKHLLIIYTHDGNSCLRVKPVPIRAVCNNALIAVLHGVEEIKILHAQSIKGKPEKVDALPEWVDSVYQRLEAVFNRMAVEKISEKQLMEYVEALVPDIERSKANAPIYDIRNAVLGLHKSGQGAGLAHGTLWGALNIVVEYADHFIPGEDPDEIGRKERLKLKATLLAAQMMKCTP
jgi:phage/plasmid-like protein (TIGR03299 family)